MSSESKILQARINGAKSRGPKTPEGKQASSRNAITHGLTAEAIVLDGESADAFNQHWLEFIDEHRPHTKTEHELVQRMAVSSWRLHRNYAREAAIIKLRMIEQAASIDSRYPGATPADRSALAFRSLADDARSLDLLNRYETRDRRAFDQALKTLLQLQSRRNHQQAEPATHHLPPTAFFPNEPNQPLPDVTGNVDDSRPVSGEQSTLNTTHPHRNPNSEPQTEPRASARGFIGQVSQVPSRSQGSQNYVKARVRIAPKFVLRGSVPNVRPSARRVAQNASATSGGLWRISSEA